jgi:hypothetical protein
MDDDPQRLREQIAQLAAEYEQAVRATMRTSASMPSPVTPEALAAWKVALEWEHQTAVRLREVSAKLTSLHLD